MAPTSQEGVAPPSGPNVEGLEQDPEVMQAMSQLEALKTQLQELITRKRQPRAKRGADEEATQRAAKEPRRDDGSHGAEMDEP